MQAKTRPQGRRARGGAQGAGLGPQRQVALHAARRAQEDEREPRLDAGPRRRLPRPEDELIDTVQRMRGKANESGNLKTTEQQMVTVEEDKIIVIESPTPGGRLRPDLLADRGLRRLGASLLLLPADVPLLPAGTPGSSPSASAWRWARRSGAAATGAGDAATSTSTIDRYNNFNRNTNINHNNLSGNRGNWNHNAGHRKGVNYQNSKVAGQYGGKAGHEPRVQRPGARPLAGGTRQRVHAGDRAARGSGAGRARRQRGAGSRRRRRQPQQILALQPRAGARASLQRQQLAAAALTAARRSPSVDRASSSRGVVRAAGSSLVRRLSRWRRLSRRRRWWSRRRRPAALGGERDMKRHRTRPIARERLAGRRIAGPRRCSRGSALQASRAGHLRHARGGGAALRRPDRARGDDRRIEEMFGPGSVDLFRSGDDDEDAKARRARQGDDRREGRLRGARRQHPGRALRRRGVAVPDPARPPGRALALRHRGGARGAAQPAHRLQRALRRSPRSTRTSTRSASTPPRGATASRRPSRSAS